MPKSKPPSFARLVDWLEGNLSKEESAAAAAQVAQADEETQATVAWLRTFFRASDTIVLESPPDRVRDVLTRRFEAYAQGRRQPGMLQRLVAALTFDSKQQWAAIGAREVRMQAPPRQFVYSTGTTDIAINIQPQTEGDDLGVSGQVLPGGDGSPDAFTVQLLQGTTEFGLTTTDELGEFTFATVPAGAYDIVLSNDLAEILILDVELEG
jgi:hypothetical protein